MDTTELHYVNFDSDAMYTAMQMAYMAAGGDVLYPGDEKEMLLRAVQAVCVSTAANADNALRMATLRYATGDYLDILGENRDCPRNQAQKATATVQVVLKPGKAGSIPAGAPLTADGKIVYATKSEITISGRRQTVLAKIEAEQEGTAGNALVSGTQMQFLSAYAGVESVVCTEDAAGGQEKEEDEIYRERIRTHGLANATTGPKNQYETAAKEVSSIITDARAVNNGAGNVGVYLLLSDETGSAALIAQVKEALNDRTERPLTDNVTVGLSSAKEYDITVQYEDETGSIAGAVAQAVEEYQKWQDETIGRAFNPDNLMAKVYQAGATRVLWKTGSTFDGGDVEYTEIGSTEHCKGTIEIEVLT